MTKYKPDTDYHTYIEYIQTTGWNDFSNENPGESLSNGDFYGFHNISNGVIYTTGVNYTQTDILKNIGKMMGVAFIHTTVDDLPLSYNGPIINYDHKYNVITAQGGTGNPDWIEENNLQKKWLVRDRCNFVSYRQSIHSIQYISNPYA